MRIYTSIMKNIAGMFKALSEATRIRIVALLTQGELCVCDLMAVLELPQSKVSRHLSYLRNTGWVEGRRQGVWTYYRLAEGDSNPYRELIPLLVNYLVKLPETKKDLASLTLYLQEKEVPECD